jgi:WD40 repeat protein/energy-coupling factor transporter ATP-binding protein EcfA2
VSAAEENPTYYQPNWTVEGDVVQTIVGGDKYDIKFYAVASVVENGDINWAQYRTESQAKAVEPYKFLSYYDTTDADLFFGREAISQQLVAKIANHKLVLINGKSGSGKTSLINAGILPLLVARGYFTMVFRDYGYPTETIKAGLASLKDTNIDLSGSNTLLNCLRVTIEQTKRPVAIFLDQFERFFLNLPTDRRGRFVRELKDCLNELNTQEMNVVVSLREDFYGRVGEFWQDIPEFNIESYHQYLEPLNQIEATDAIEKPLQRMRVKVGYDSEFLANCLVPNLLQRSEGESNEQIEPVHLQIVCNRLFEEVRIRYHKHIEAGKIVTIKQDIYDELGGVEGILQRYVDDILNQRYSREQQDEVKSVLKQMVTSQGTREFKSVAAIAENISLVEKRVTEIVQQLDRSRLIETIPAEVDAQRKYSITHEYLAKQINQWYTLNELELKRARELYERCLVNWKLNKQNRIPRSQFKYLQKYKSILLKWKPEGKQLFRESELLYHGLNFSVTLGIVTLVGVTIAALIGQRSAAIGEVRASRQASEAFFNAGNRQLEALTEALKAGTTLQRHPLLQLWKPDQYLPSRVRGTLWKAFYQTPEQSRLWHQDGVNSAQFSPDGNYIVTASNDNTAKVWNRQGELLATLEGHQGWVDSAQFSPDGNYIATASKDNTAKVWNRQGELLATLEGHQDWVNSVSFSPDSNSIVTASSDGTEKVWNRQGELLATLEGYQEGGISAQFSPDGNSIVTASKDNTAKVWNRQGELLATLEGHQDWVWSAQFSPDGNSIVTTSRDRTAKVWNLQGELLATLEGHQDWVWSAQFSPDSNSIVTASVDRTAKVWNLKGELLATLEGHQEEVTRGVQFSSDGNFIVTVSFDKTAKVWNLQGKLLATFEGEVTSAQFSPDSDSIVITSSDGTAKVWNLQSKLFTTLEVTTLEGHQDWVQSAQFSPDGNSIVTASKDNTAKMWNLQGELLATLEGHESFVKSAQFSPDGNSIVTSSNDGTAKLWPFPPLSELSAQACARVGGYLKHHPDVDEADRNLCDGVPVPTE